MTDIFKEVEEDLRHEHYEKLAKKYGPYALAGAVALVAGTGGYVAWNNWQQSQNQAQTTLLAKALATSPSGDSKPTQALAEAARQLDSGKATLAHLVEAALHQREGKKDVAAEIYQTLAVGGEPLFRDLGVLLAVSSRLDSGDPVELEQRLAPLRAAGNPWRPSATELTALLALRRGDKAQAVAYFQQLAADADAPPALKTRAGELAAFYGKTGT
jgi:hypothetical protein